MKEKLYYETYNLLSTKLLRDARFQAQGSRNHFKMSYKMAVINNNNTKHQIIVGNEH